MGVFKCTEAEATLIHPLQNTPRAHLPVSDRFGKFWVRIAYV